MLPREFAQHAGEKVRAIVEWPPPAAGRLAVIGDLVLGILQEGHHLLRPGLQQPPRVGQRYPPPLPLEDRLAQFLFQVGNGPAERRLGNAELLCRTGETLPLSRFQEVAQLEQFHGRASPRVMRIGYDNDNLNTH
jgi:hypothetical protein